MVSRPSDTLIGARLRLEKVDPARVQDLTDAVVASLPELEQFMDWARPETATFASFDEFVTRSLDEWESGASHTFHVIEAATGELVGNCGLMRRVGPGAIEIGYWIRSDRAGRGYATEAARLLVGAAWLLDDVERVEIHFDAANGASARVAEKTGAVEIERREVEIDNPGEIGVELIAELVIPPRRPFETSDHHPPEEVDGDRLRFVRTTAALADELSVAMEASLPALKHHLHWARAEPTDPEVLAAFLAEWTAGWVAGSLYGYTIFDKTTGEVVGGVGFERTVGPRSVEVAYWTRTDVTGHGIATEALAMMTGIAWTLPDIDRIVLIHDVVNHPSARVAVKNGFVEFDRRTIPILGGRDSGTVVWRELLRPADA